MKLEDEIFQLGININKAMSKVIRKEESVATVKDGDRRTITVWEDADGNLEMMITIGTSDGREN